MPQETGTSYKKKMSGVAWITVPVAVAYSQGMGYLLQA
jgi:hypothetical protein